MAEIRLSRAFGLICGGRLYQELCPGVVRSAGSTPCQIVNEPREADDPVRCPCQRGCKPDARAAAAVGRRRRLRAVSSGRQPAADRSRHDVADHGRAMDPRSPRGARDRRVFLHHARPALDLDAMAGAGGVCQELCAVRLERAGGDFGSRDRGHLRAVHEIPEPAFERKHHAGVRRRGAGADGAASAGAAACAGDAGHGGVGLRTDRGRRSPRGAVVLAAAADGAVVQPAWRFCLRPGADRADRARCGGRARKPIRAARWCCAGRRSAWPR